jgi:hypothetical protein
MVHHIKTKKDRTQLQQITRIQAQKTQSKTQQKLCKKKLAQCQKNYNNKTYVI